MNNSISTLYICYFGLREPLVQTQVLPYLRQLVAAGVRVSLLTFEPELRARWSVAELQSASDELKKDGIVWSHRPYHKRPSLPATTFDVVAGAVYAARLARRAGIDVLHARAHVPAAMALLALWLIRRRLFFVFDIRGLMAEEYQDAGVWRERSVAFRTIKWIENKAIRRADQIIVLTNRMREWLMREKNVPAANLTVVPCCVDFSRFDQTMRHPVKTKTTDERFEAIYAGSVTGLYLLEEMGRFFLALRARQTNARLVILTTSPARAATDVLLRVGLQPDDFWIGAVSAAEVPAYLQRARVGLSFRKATFSQIAASPTKIPEYLAAGLPVVCNAGVGDVDDLLARERVGIVINSLTSESYAEAAARLLALVAEPDTSVRCRHAAHNNFDLISVGGAGYGRAYRRMADANKKAHGA